MPGEAPKRDNPFGSVLVLAVSTPLFSFPSPAPVPTLLRGGATESQDHKVVPGIQLRPVFQLSLAANRASAFFIYLLTSLFIHLPLSRSTLHRHFGGDRDDILSLSIDQGIKLFVCFFWLQLIVHIMQNTDLRYLCFR
jgi:hypothetical protein